MIENPQILKWARETAGLSLEEAAAKALQKDGAHLANMEAGEIQPTPAQLVKLGKTYHRNTLVFYLPEIPKPGPATTDFRTTKGNKIPEARLNTLVRNVRVRQALVRSALEDMEEEKPLPFVGSMTIEQGAQAITEKMRAVLEIDIADYRRAPDHKKAFNRLRKAVEETGVYVMLIGNLGNHKTKIEPDIFRGFALADDDVIPFIVINEYDSQAAWAFTLLHELAHVFLKQSGISGGDADKSYDVDKSIEKICDQAASSFLLDPAELKEFKDEERSLGDWKQDISTFASKRKLSRKMVAYNLLKNGYILNETYEQLFNNFHPPQVSQQSSPQGRPNYYVVRKHRMGKLTQLTVRLLNNGALTYTKAAQVLGVPSTSIDKMR